jgi:hypothetical protein
VTAAGVARRQVTDPASRSDAVRSFDVASVSAAGAAGSASPATPTADLTAATPASSVSPAIRGSGGDSPSRWATRVIPHPVTTKPPAPKVSQTGQASWYSAYSGTCAHPTVPLGTVVTITDLDNGRSTICRVEDRGPFLDGRVIDMSETTFSQLAPLGAGVIEVRLTW